MSQQYNLCKSYKYDKNDDIVHVYTANCETSLNAKNQIYFDTSLICKSVLKIVI